VIQVKSIELTNFKRVSKIRCEFDDLTVSAGLNNSGTTMIIQGIYLLFVTLPRLIAHQNLTHANPSTRTVALQSALSPLDVRGTT
jgi:predicted ATPase